MTDQSPSPALRKTGRRVRVTDRLARTIISGGGLAVLAAMFGIMVFLVLVAAPLFRGARVVGHASHGTVSGFVRPQTVRMINGTDLAFQITSAGRFMDFDLSSGRVHTDVQIAPEDTVTALDFEPGRWRAAMGTDDGRVLIYKVDDRWHLVPDTADDIPEVAPGEEFKLDDPGLRNEIAQALDITEDLSDLSYLATDQDGQRILWEPILQPEAEFRIKFGEGPVIRVDSNGIGDRRRFIVVIREDRTGVFGMIRQTVRLDGEGSTYRLRPYEFKLPEEKPVPDYCFLTANGANIIMVWEDGSFLRYDSAQPSRGIAQAEEGRLVEPGRSITSCVMALGGATLIAGDSTGEVHSYLVVETLEAQSADGRVLQSNWKAQAGQGEVLSLEPGDRDRTVAVATSDDLVSLYHVTSHKRLFHQRLVDDLSIAAASPSLELLVAISSAGEYASLHVDPGYPAVSFDSLFGKVHYEGYDRPEYVYQSTGDAQSEPKYSLIPLLFGTIKATVFAMIFALPLAIAAAIYTSEFMHKRMQRVVKPTIELMASLPSVVIGFVAAIFVAPLMRDWLPGIMVAMFVIPLSAAFVGTLWQMIPPRLARRLGSRTQMCGAIILFLVVSFVGGQAGPIVEDLLFAPSRSAQLVAAGSYEPVPEGTSVPFKSTQQLTQAQQAAFRAQGLFVVGDQVVQPVDEGQTLPPAGGSIEKWLDGNFGQPFPGWLVAMIFPGVLIVPLVMGRLITRRWSSWLETIPRGPAAVAEVFRMLVTLVAIFLFAGAMAYILSRSGFDPRDSIFGPFTPKNTLVVGIVMGLAVIPIIYTISEDALSSVPNTLRSASLGTGATKWQTAWRVVLPVAASGIFSAIMVGLGRAVGETMIVLMATGNTPEMKWNLFSGFRTLAANIAVELPEAARGDAHYRVLFLCGLALFIMTLFINTLAELVRQHFRKRNAAL